MYIHFWCVDLFECYRSFSMSNWHVFDVVVLFVLELPVLTVFAAVCLVCFFLLFHFKTMCVTAEVCIQALAHLQISEIAAGVDCEKHKIGRCFVSLFVEDQNETSLFTRPLPLFIAASTFYCKDVQKYHR